MTMSDRILYRLCLIMLLAVVLIERCPGQEVMPEALQKQRDKIAELKQRLDQQRSAAEAVQQEMRQREQDMRRKYAEAEREYAEARSQFQELQAKAEADAANDRNVAVFTLKYLPADEAASAVSRVLGDGSPRHPLRVAVDERANRVIVSSASSQIDSVKQLLQSLDVKSAEPVQLRAAQASPEMLRLRVIWVSNDPAAGKEESAMGTLDQPVLDSPTVVCQTVTSLVVTKRGDNNSFGFASPVELGKSVLRFEGSGNVEANEGGRFLVHIQLVVKTAESGGGLRGSPFTSQVQGAIATPLGNFTILGTGVVVVHVPTPDGATRVPKQVPCAFVLQLTQADDFPAGAAGPDVKN
jgi:hypothetical protein